VLAAADESTVGEAMTLAWQAAARQTTRKRSAVKPRARRARR